MSFHLGLLLLASLDQNSDFRVLSLCYDQPSHGLNLQSHCWSELVVCPCFLSASGIKCPDKSNSQEECLILTHSFLFRSITAEKPQWRSLWQLTTAHSRSRAKTWMQPCSLLSAQPTFSRLVHFRPLPVKWTQPHSGWDFHPIPAKKIHSWLVCCPVSSRWFFIAALFPDHSRLDQVDNQPLPSHHTDRCRFSASGHRALWWLTFFISVSIRLMATLSLHWFFALRIFFLIISLYVEAYVHVCGYLQARGGAGVPGDSMLGTKSRPSVSVARPISY